MFFKECSTLSSGVCIQLAVHHLELICYCILYTLTGMHLWFNYNYVCGVKGTFIIHVILYIHAI